MVRVAERVPGRGAAVEEGAVSEGLLVPLKRNSHLHRWLQRRGVEADLVLVQDDRLFVPAWLTEELAILVNRSSDVRAEELDKREALLWLAADPELRAAVLAAGVLSEFESAPTVDTIRQIRALLDAAMRGRRSALL